MESSEFGRKIKLALTKKHIKDKEPLIEVFTSRFMSQADQVLSFLDKVCGYKLTPVRVIQWYNLWNKFGLDKKEISSLEKNKAYSYEETIEQLEKNPYKFIKLPLVTCDRIAQKFKLDLGSERKRSLMVRHIRDLMIEYGHTCIPNGMILRSFGNWMEEKTVVTTEFDLVEYKDCIYFKKQYLEEQQVAQFIHKTACFLPDSDFSLPLDSPIKLTEEQSKAIKTACSSNCSLITGPAGSGKTTLIACLIDFLESKGITSVVLSFTGKAVSRIKSVTKRGNIHTIHKFIYKMEEKPNVVIFDEASMIPLGLMARLARILEGSVQLIFIGDPSQLPAIRPGMVFDDLIECGKFPHTELTITHRFKGSIFENSRRIMVGKSIEKGTDVEIIPCRTDEYSEQVREIFKKNDLYDKGMDVTILCCYNKQIAEFNTLCQELCNPYAQQKKVKVYGEYVTWKVGDRVMMLNNNYHWNVFNGEEGNVISLESDRLQVRFPDDRIVDYLYAVPDTSLSKEELTNSKNVYLSDLQHSWSISVHKSQGSEYEIIIFPIPSYLRGGFISRRLIYTLMTRAKQKVFILGNTRELNQLMAQPILRRIGKLSELL